MCGEDGPLTPSQITCEEGMWPGIINSSYTVMADYKAVAVYRCHYVKIFSCSKMVVARFPKFTLQGR